MVVACLSQTEAAEAILIHLAEKARVDRRTVQHALKISRRTYYRRRRLPADVLARALREGAVSPLEPEI